MKRLFALLLLAAFSMTHLTACNTMAGAGKDVQKVGEMAKLGHHGSTGAARWRASAGWRCWPWHAWRS